MLINSSEMVRVHQDQHSQPGLNLNDEALVDIQTQPFQYLQKSLLDNGVNLFIAAHSRKTGHWSNWSEQFPTGYKGWE